MTKPKIRAEFGLDPNHNPIAIAAGDKIHYTIRLFMENVPEDAQEVIYQLDETYYNPTREIRRDQEGFRENITSYGDYVVKAQIRRKTYSDLVTAYLSEALRETYGDTPSDAIQKAIEQVEKN